MRFNSPRIIAGLVGAALVLSAIAYPYVAGSGDANLSTRPKAFSVNGETRQITLIASTDASREKGLMDSKITNATFVLFAFPTRGFHTFWMYHTNSSLDIVWIDGTEAGGRVVYLVMDATSCYTDSCPRYTPDSEANFAIEGKAGFAETLGITNGTEVQFH